jgi:hypothetical protein
VIFVKAGGYLCLMKKNLITHKNKIMWLRCWIITYYLEINLFQELFFNFKEKLLACAKLHDWGPEYHIFCCLIIEEMLLYNFSMSCFGLQGKNIFKTKLFFHSSWSEGEQNKRGGYDFLYWDLGFFHRYLLYIASRGHAFFCFYWGGGLLALFYVTLDYQMNFRCLIHKAHLRFWRNFWEFYHTKYIQFCAAM